MSELEGKIRAWLDAQGYPLEMRVARAFRGAGFRVLQSDYYQDRQTETFREVDVIAWIDHRAESFFARIQFVIECKSSRDKPWLMFCSSEATLAPPARVAQRTASKVASAVLLEVAQRKEIQDLDLFQIIDPPAYGATQAFTTGSDIVYTALTGVGGAVSAKAHQVDRDRRLARRFCLILFPVVVVEGRLFSCVLQEDKIVIAETERTTLLWRNPVAGEPHTIVSILTDRGLEEFAKRAIASAQKFFELTKADFGKAFKPPSPPPFILPGLK